MSHGIIRYCEVNLKLDVLRCLSGVNKTLRRIGLAAQAGQVPRSTGGSLGLSLADKKSWDLIAQYNELHLTEQRNNLLNSSDTYMALSRIFSI